MKYQDFENKIASQFYNEETYVDMPSLLNNLGLNKKKERRILWLPIFLVSIGGLLAGYYYYFGSKPSRQVHNEQNIASDYAASTEEKNATSKVETKTSLSAIKDENINIEKNTSLNSTLTASLNRKKLSNKISIPVNKDEESTIAMSVKESTIQKNELFATDKQEENTNHNLTNELISINPIASLSQSLSKKETLPLFHKDVECPTFSKKSNFYFELIPEIGVFKPFKKLESLSAEPNAVLNLRNENEKSLEGFQAGLYLKLRNTKTPFSFRTGLEYQQLTEKMSLNYEYTTRDTTIGIISVTVSQTGDTITTIYGPIVSETLHSGKQVAHHQFRTFDIPLVLGYEKSLGSFDIGIEAGVSLNVSLRTNGNLLTTTNSFATLPDNNLYKSSIGLNYLGSIYLAKNFESIGRFYVALRGRMIPSSFNNEANSIKQNYTYAGLHLGYVFVF